MAQNTTSFLAPRPLERISLPKEAARKKLANRLHTVLSLQEPYTEALSRAFVNPEQVRRQLDQLCLKRFPGGVAKFIHADVLAPAISISPINPRERERLPYPVSARRGQKIPPPLAIENAADGRPSLVLIAE